MGRQFRSIRNTANLLHSYFNLFSFFFIECCWWGAHSSRWPSGLQDTNPSTVWGTLSPLQVAGPLCVHIPSGVQRLVVMCTRWWAHRGCTGSAARSKSQSSLSELWASSTPSALASSKEGIPDCSITRVSKLSALPRQLAINRPEPDRSRGRILWRRPCWIRRRRTHRRAHLCSVSRARGCEHREHGVSVLHLMQASAVPIGTDTDTTHRHRHGRAHVLGHAHGHAHSCF